MSCSPCVPVGATYSVLVVGGGPAACRRQCTSSCIARRSAATTKRCFLLCSADLFRSLYVSPSLSLSLCLALSPPPRPPFAPSPHPPQGFFLVPLPSPPRRGGRKAEGGAEAPLLGSQSESGGTDGGRAMRQRILGSHTPPCHRRMVITTQFNVSPRCTAALLGYVPLQVVYD